MNKKLFFSMFAATGMLLATSCSNDELNAVQSEEKVQVTFSLGVEDGIGSRAAISDGTNINKLVYGVFDSKGNPLNVLEVNREYRSQKVDEVNNITTTPHNISITLAKGQSYQVAFWAQNANCKAYNTENLKEVTVSYKNENNENAANNDDLRDAFFKTVEFEVSGNKTIDVVLQRPFAQINVGVTQEDWDAALRSGINIMESSVVISKAATKINLLDGSVDGEVAVEYDFATIPYQFTTPEALEVDVNKNGTIEEDEKYKWLSMSYILVADETTGNAGATLEGLEYIFQPEQITGETIHNQIHFSKGLAGAPVQRNWRTNIVGKILTGDIDFNITVDKKFENSNTYPSTPLQELQFAATFGGSVTLTENIELTETLSVNKDMVLDLNGHTLNGVIKNNAILTIKDTKDNSSVMSDLTIVSAKESTIQGEGVILIYDETAAEYQVLQGAAIVNNWPEFMAAYNGGKQYIVLAKTMTIGEVDETSTYNRSARNTVTETVTDTLKVLEGKHLTIDLNGHALHGTINNYSALTIKNGDKSEEPSILKVIGNKPICEYVNKQGTTDYFVLTRGAFDVVNADKLSAAIANGNSYIILTGDITASGSYEIESGNTVVVELLGYILNGTINNGGTLTIKDSYYSENKISDLTINDAGGTFNEGEGVNISDDKIYPEPINGPVLVSTWDEFTAVKDGKYVILTKDITYNANYQLQKNVIINLNGKSMTLPMINIHTETTVKNGTINGKMYARTGCKATLEGLTFSGTISDDLSTEGHLQVQGSCDVYAKNCTFAATTVNGSQTRSLSIEGSSSGIRKFEGCDFKFVSWGTGAGKYKKNVYINTMNGTTTVDFTDCKLNGKAPNILFAGTYSLTNLTMSSCDNTAPTLEINRAKDTVTEVEWAHISSLIANNKFTQVRVFYAGGSSEYIK